MQNHKTYLHGFQGKCDLWHIQIRCFMENEFLFYQIKDDGLGISVQELENLKLVFGRKCGIKISSQEGAGTVILMKYYINSCL